MAKKKTEEFSYVIARPWDKEKDPLHLCVYTYHHEIQHGTLGGAQDMLDYVKRQTAREGRTAEADDYAIYRIEFQKL